MDDSSKLMCTPEHKAGRVALWLSCVACFELSASVYAGNGASQAVHLPADGVSYKTVHHLLGHFHDGRLPKQFKKFHKIGPSDSFFWILLMDASFVMYCKIDVTKMSVLCSGAPVNI